VSVAADAARASFATNLSFLAAAPLGVGRRRDRCGDGLRPTLGVVHMQDAGNNGFDGFALLGIELGDGLELKLESLVGPPLILLKKQRICAHAERQRNAPKHFDGGLGSAGLIALVLRDVACAVPEGDGRERVRAQSGAGREELGGVAAAG